MNYAAIDENGIYGGMVTAVEATAPDVGFYAPEGIRISRFDAPPTDEPGKWIETASGWRELDAAEALTIMRESFTVRIQQHLDNFAKTRNYDNTFTAATYATSSNSRFASEGRYIVEARDAVWAKAYEIMDDVLSGRRALPSFEEILAELPKLEWPSSAPAPLAEQGASPAPLTEQEASSLAEQAESSACAPLAEQAESSACAPLDEQGASPPSELDAPCSTSQGATDNGGA